MNLPMKRPEGPRRRWDSVYSTLMVFLISVIVAAALLTAAAYALLLVVGMLANPYARLLTMPILMAFFITTLAAGMGKGKLKPINDLVEAMREVSQGDFSVRVDATDVTGDMGRLVTSFNDMAGELGGLEMFRKDFINNFSHEFKTPIVSIQGFAHQLQAGGLTPEEEREYIRIIADESDRLAKMATNILLLSKLENQAIVTEKTEFWLDEQLRTCLVLLEKQWGPKELELNLELDEVKYYFNENMLSQVWLNLFSNAIKFTPKGGTLSCSLKADESTVTVKITDTGCGMSEDTVRHIFDKFYQGDTSHTGDGNGIGLNIVSRILYLCGGSVKVESEIGSGSTFTVTLPVTVPPYTDVQSYSS